MGRLGCGVHKFYCFGYALHCTDLTVIVDVSNEAVNSMRGKRPETSSTGSGGRGKCRLGNLRMH